MIYSAMSSKCDVMFYSMMITMMEYNSVFKFHEVSDDYENI